ncbi:hypothetical protein CBS147347_10873 [Aspergillus niger]|nr:hypothetical protein CBS147347_10873 [Aspergillus niger]
MQATGKRLIQYVGNVALADIQNATHREAVSAFCARIEQENPKVKKAEIKGSQPHKSHDDPEDKLNVISIRFKDDGDIGLGTAHVHEDGTGNVRWNKWKK